MQCKLGVVDADGNWQLGSPAPASATDDKTQTVASYKRRAPAVAAAPFSASNLQAAVHHKARAKAKKSTKKSKPVGQGEQPEPNAEEQPAAAGAGAGAASCLTLRTRTRRWAVLARHPRAPPPCPAAAQAGATRTATRRTTSRTAARRRLLTIRTE